MTREQQQAFARLARSTDWPLIRCVLEDFQAEFVAVLARQHDLHTIAQTQGMHQFIDSLISEVELAPKKV